MSISAVAAEGWTRLLSSGGTLGHAKRVNGYGAVDFVTGTRAADTLVETDLISIVTDFATAEVDGTLIQQGDRMVTSDSTVDIADSDMLKIGETLYNIVSVRKVDFAGLVVGYKIHARL